MNNLAKSVHAYLEFCGGLFRPLMDGQPWSEIAVNPAPVFRAKISLAEKSAAFKAVAMAFDQLADPTDFVIEGPDRTKHFWHVAAFFWNRGVYDAVIRGEQLDAEELAEAMSCEGGRGDVRYKQAAYLDSFASVAQVDVGPFSIRHLTVEEIDQVFAGRCQLDHRESPESVREKLAESWFAVVDNPARPLADYISFGGAVGHHDWEGTFRNINLGLNLFNAAPGAVMLSHTYHWSTSLFHRQQHECPEPSGDLYPSSWGGTEEPPAMRMYRLSADDLRQLPVFWQAFGQAFLDVRRLLPSYLHRAIGRFLEACGPGRTDYEFRQVHYVMALEALFSGEPEERVQPTDQYGNEAGPVLSVARCCANLVVRNKPDIARLSEWLGGDRRKDTKGIYQQRSRIVHGSTFEQQEFYSQPQNPDEHREAAYLCKILGVETDPVWEGPDMGFAVLHNAVRLSLLNFIGHAGACLRTDRFKQITDQLAAETGKDKLAQEKRHQFRVRLHDLFLEEKRSFLNRLYGSIRNEIDRQKIRSEIGGLVSQSR